MKIDDNGTIREMTEEEVAEHTEAAQGMEEQPNLDAKVDTLIKMVGDLTAMLQGKTKEE